ncbi:unnamed protein product [Protopolystoma xenopodis]|uniref:Uncharacterized protein n=1 Tax=Protopolystoma xenopodis TaxID=117903 RepID=A0A3S5B036_9PLAT|nr:unnamed protein product [Protopolystoma xenopodis]
MAKMAVTYLNSAIPVPKYSWSDRCHATQALSDAKSPVTPASKSELASSVDILITSEDDRRMQNRQPRLLDTSSLEELSQPNLLSQCLLGRTLQEATFLFSLALLPFFELAADIRSVCFSGHHVFVSPDADSSQSSHVESSIYTNLSPKLVDPSNISAFVCALAPKSLKSISVRVDLIQYEETLGALELSLFFILSLTYGTFYGPEKQLTCTFKDVYDLFEQVCESLFLAFLKHHCIQILTRDVF